MQRTNSQGRLNPVAILDTPGTILALSALLAIATVFAPVAVAAAQSGPSAQIQIPPQSIPAAQPQAPQAPSQTSPPAQTSAPAKDASAAPDASSPQPADAADSALLAEHPLAIVPLDSKIPGGAVDVTGELQVFNGRAFITGNGSITSGNKTLAVTVPYRGTLRVCASTKVNLTVDSSVPSGEIPGLMISMDHGAVEASFATGRNSDFLLTPDFRILIGGPGAAEVKLRLGAQGDTCVDNAGVNAPYVLVTSVFDGGDYRVQSGQRVMFQHGSVHEVVDQEKEPCGCPPETKGANDFPLAQSEGLAPTLHPAPSVEGQAGHAAQSSDALVYNGAAARVAQAPAAAPAPSSATPKAPAEAAPPAAAAPENPQPASAPRKRRGFFKRLGGFFRKVFGAD
jgi:hypothetical protein